MANEEHLALLRQGATAWNQCRSNDPDLIPDLSGADLSGANLGMANLELADLSGADLTKEHLSWTYLSWTYLSWTYLDAANFSKVTLSHTSFSDVDLSEVKGLRSVTHYRPSSIGVDTLSRTLRGSGGKIQPEHLEFLAKAGVPPTLLEYLPSILQSAPLQFYSCFLSYSTFDEAIADQLHSDLNKEGMRTWKWDLNAVAGRTLRNNIDRAITIYDKIILICSINSLTSGPVNREIEKALQKEDQLNAAKAGRTEEAFAAGEEPSYVDTNVLVPIRVDDYVFQWDSPLASQLKRRYIPDFADTNRVSEEYQKAFSRLVKALSVKSWPEAEQQ